MSDEAREMTAPRRRWLAYLPIVLFAVVAAVFAIQLSAPPTGTLPSQLISKPAPALDLPQLGSEDGRLTHADFAQAPNVTVVNYWASWCGPCRIEHPELMRLAERDDVRMLGVAYHDKPEASQKFLDELGDPFAKVGMDQSGETALRWGIEGVPETFVIDGAGRVVYKHSGPIQNNDYAQKILPAIEQAKSAK